MLLHDRTNSRVADGSQNVTQFHVCYSIHYLLQTSFIIEGTGVLDYYQLTYLRDNDM